MKQPSLENKDVKVWAYLTDAAFGYDHWKATQFYAPEHSKPAILLLFDTEKKRDKWFETFC